MKVHVAAGASEEEASAIAAAVAEHVGETVEVFLGDGDEPAVVHDVDASPATDGQTSDRPVPRTTARRTSARQTASAASATKSPTSTGAALRSTRTG